MILNDNSIEPTAPLTENMNNQNMSPVKRVGKKTAFVSIFLLGLLLFLWTANFIRNNQFEKKEKNPSKYQVSNSTNTNIKPTKSAEITNTSELTKYTSLKYGFVFEYPKNAKKKTSIDIQKTYQEYQVGENKDGSDPEESKLKDGWIFKVRVHEDISDRTLDDLSSKIRQQYELNCSKNVNIEQINKTNMIGLEAIKFNVTNCPLNYTETFIKRDQKIFEFIQIYKGDLGYETAYKNITNDILNSFKFLRFDEIQQSETESFTNQNFGISFEHKRLNPNCCTTNGPISPTAEKIIILGNSNQTDQKPGQFNGLGVFGEWKVLNKTTFDQYVADQKTKLIQEYKLVKGVEPQTQEKDIQVGGVNGKLLENYAWWGDMIILPINRAKDPSILIIVKSEVTKGAFTDDFNEILSTFTISN